MMRHLSLALVLLIASFATPALAVEARIPIHSTTTINAPGTYFLARAISGAGPLITITASDVDLDLNGFTLTPTSGAGIFASGVERVDVHGGFIVGGQSAIRLDTVTGARIEQIGSTAATGAAIRVIASSMVVIEDSILRNALAEAILVDGTGMADPPQVQIIGNQLLGTTGSGITLTAAGSSLIARNTINSVGGRGIYVTSSNGVQVTENVIHDTAQAGIALISSGGNELRDNVIRAAVTDGIVVDAGSSENAVTGNQATACGGNGMQVGGDRNVVSSNLIGGNTGWGLYFNANANDNVFRTNVARGNSGGACAGGSANFCNTGGGNTTAGDNYLPNLF
jgi:parallel beta-helix repeat protein